MIRGQMFSRQVASPGQKVWVYNDGTRTDSWVVPEGVTSICAVCVNSTKSSGIPSAIKRGATTLFSANTVLGGGVGGGDGGNSGGSSDGAATGGGGGAGGYSGAGGAGAYAVRQPTPGSYTAAGGNSGTGGGGGGGGCNTSGNGGSGGGVGLLGTGTNGSGGSAGTLGGAGSQRTGSGAYGGAHPTSPGGGNLRWRNDIPVTPGETLQITGAGYLPYGNIAAVRIMWGGGRSFPSNALDM